MRSPSPACSSLRVRRNWPRDSAPAPSSLVGWHVAEPAAPSLSRAHLCGTRPALPQRVTVADRLGAQSPDEDPWCGGDGDARPARYATGAPCARRLERPDPSRLPRLGAHGLGLAVHHRLRAVLLG